MATLCFASGAVGTLASVWHEVLARPSLRRVEACEERGLDTGNPDGAFVAAVAAGTPASPDVDDALRAHEVTGACYRSAESGGVPVTVEAQSVA